MPGASVLPLRPFDYTDGRADGMLGIETGIPGGEAPGSHSGHGSEVELLKLRELAVERPTEFKIHEHRQQDQRDYG